MLLIFGASSNLGQELIKDYPGEVYGVSRKVDNSKMSQECKYISADLNEYNNILEKIGHKVAEDIETIIFTHRYRANSNEDYDIEEEVRVSAVAPICISEIIASTSKKLKNIIFVSSSAATNVTGEQHTGYHMGKACINIGVKVLSSKLAKRKIAVNAISLSYVNKHTVRTKKKINLEIGKLATPRGEVASVSEISKIIIALIKMPNDAVMTGSIISLDCGLTSLEHSWLAKVIGENL